MERERKIEEEREQRSRTEYREGSSGARGEPQTDLGHPPEYAGDLNPDHMAGQNIGQPSAEPVQDARSARDDKEVNRALSDRFSDDELGAIPVLDAGMRLQQGATYIDLRDPERREFTATGDMSATGGQRLVPKSQVPYSLWNRLRGIDDVERAPEQGGRGGG